MLTAVVTLALFGVILTLVVDVVRRDGMKVIAALEGHSWTAQPAASRPVAIRFNGSDREAVPVRGLPGLRAAA